MDTSLHRTTRDMKKGNVMLVAGALKSLGSATKAELAEQTKLSIATCGTILNEMLLSGEARVVELEASYGGRPATRYRYNPDFFSLLSLYVAGSDDGANIIWSCHSATGELLTQGEMPLLPMTLEAFYLSVSTLFNKFSRVQAIGIGLPGVIVHGVAVSCDISLFTGVDVKRQIAAQFGCFAEVDNNINFTAWGFYNNTCEGISEPVAYIYKPPVLKPGCGIVINGQILPGMSNFAGEVGYLPFNARTTLPLMDEITRIITTLTAVINPVKIAVSCAELSVSQLAEIRQSCLDYVPEQHLPELIFRDAMRPDYLQGITSLTLKNFNYQRIFTF